MTERHIHVCDCDECLNGGSGEAMAGAGQVVSTEPADVPEWRWGKLTGNGEQVRAAENAARRAIDERARARKAVA